MADTEKEIYQLVTDKQKEMKPIFDRMDEDEKLYLLERYVMKHLPPDSSRSVEDVANTTLNDPLLYATKAISIIGGATMQTIVEGRNMPPKQITKIEEFLNDIFYMVDELLVKREIPGLDAFINEQICLRGSIAARSCIRIDKERGFLPDVLPLDTRCFTPEADETGMVSGAANFRRSKAKVEREYPEAKGLGASNNVVDFWNNERNIDFVNMRSAKNEENSYKYPPFIYVICPIGSMLNTEGALKHRGESIFWADRDLWPVMNETATILRTLNVNSLFGALQYASDKGEKPSKPEKSPYKQKTVHGVEKGGGYTPMPVSDIKAATRLFYSIVETRQQRGSLSAVDYGSLAFPLSAIAITRLTGSRDDIFLPRIQAKALFYQALSRMIIKQCIALGKTIELGEEGSKNKYSSSDLKGVYTIKYRFFTDSKEQTAADLAIANAARGFLSDDYIRRELMKVQDPDGMEAQLKSQEAEKTDEVLFLYRRACALLDEAEKKQGKERKRKEFEASLLGQRIETILRQRKTMGTLSPIEGKGEPKAPQGKELLPLFGGGGGGGRRRPAEPTEETEEVESGKV